MRLEPREEGMRWLLQAEPGSGRCEIQFSGKEVQPGMLSLPAGRREGCEGFHLRWADCDHGITSVSQSLASPSRALPLDPGQVRERLAGGGQSYALGTDGQVGAQSGLLSGQIYETKINKHVAQSISHA